MKFSSMSTIGKNGYRANRFHFVLTCIQGKMSLFRYGFEKKSKSQSEEATTSATTLGDKNIELSDDSEPETETASVSTPPAKKPKKDIVRKYDAAYLAYGFISTGTEELPLPFCLVCKNSFSNGSMKPSHMKRHLQNKHPNEKGKPIEYFAELKNQMKSQSKNITSFMHSEIASIEASFAVALEIAKAKKPFMVGEQLIQPCLTKAVEIMLGPAALAKVNSIPLSRDTVKRRIAAMARDVERQLVTRLKTSGHFTLQFDESTDISGEAILLGFVRYSYNGKLCEELFCICSLGERTTGEQIFAAINTKMQEYGLDWKNVIGVCTDGAAAMTGSKSGLAKRLSEIANDDFLATHCTIHREALASKQISSELNGTLLFSVKMINHIKAHALQSRIFANICAEMGEEHKALLLHTEVRWLSRGKVFNRLYELREDVRIYFERSVENKKRKKAQTKEDAKPITKSIEELFLEAINNKEWLSQLAYLSDIFGRLNEFNLGLQGRNINCFTAWNKIEAFQKQISVWAEQAELANFEAFPMITEFLDANDDATLINFIQPIIVDHLQNLLIKFKKYFPDSGDPRKFHLWVENPFLNVNEPNHLNVIEKKELLGKLFHIIFCWDDFNLMLHF